MSDAGTVNDQITDAVTQGIAAVLGHAPAESSAMLDAVMAETLGMSMHNAVTAQHNMQMVSAASVTATCARIIQGGPPEQPTASTEAADESPVSPLNLSPEVAMARDTGQALAAIEDLETSVDRASQAATTGTQDLQTISTAAANAATDEDVGSPPSGSPPSGSPPSGRPSGSPPG